MEKKGINQGSVGIAGGRMNHHSLWFVYNQKVTVFIYNIKGNILSCHARADRLGGDNLYPVPQNHLTALDVRLAVNCNIPRFNKANCSGSGNFGVKKANCPVKTHRFLKFNLKKCFFHLRHSA